MPESEPPEEVAASTLRRLFLEARVEERLRNGELTIVVRKNTERPARPQIGEPPGTVSHALVYLDPTGTAVAIAHEYLRPDGTTGASGLRDPKWLRHAGRRYMLARDPTP